MESFIKKGYKYLVFSPFDYEHKWFHSESDKNIEVLISNEWLIQYENHLPKILIIGDIVEFKTSTNHRLIPGKGNLVLRYKQSLQ